MLKIKDDKWNEFRTSDYAKFGYKKIGRKFVKFNEYLAVHITKSKIETYPLTHLSDFFPKRQEFLQELYDVGLVEKVED